jgi:putative membrane protein
MARSPERGRLPLEVIETAPKHPVLFVAPSALPIKQSSLTRWLRVTLLSEVVEGDLSDSKTDAPTEMKQRAELRDYLAAERTLLAWIRTGLALMGFGFVVARFGLFLQEIQVAQPTFSAHSYGLSLWFGTALIAAGVVVNLISGWQYSRLVRDLDRGHQTLHRPPALAVAITLFLALVGLAMTIYLISLRGSAHSNSGNNSRQNEEMPIAPTADNGIMSIPSNHSVDPPIIEEMAAQNRNQPSRAVIVINGSAAA